MLKRGSVVEARYVVEAKLGEGGLAAVNRVLRCKLGTEYALKLLKPYSIRNHETQGSMVAPFQRRSNHRPTGGAVRRIGSWARSKGQAYFCTCRPRSDEDPWLDASMDPERVQPGLRQPWAA